MTLFSDMGHDISHACACAFMHEKCTQESLRFFDSLDLPLPFQFLFNYIHVHRFVLFM